VDALAYYETTRDALYGDRYQQAAMLIAFFVGLQCFHFLTVRFKVHASR
jgi:hypothetical protein